MYDGEVWTGVGVRSDLNRVFKGPSMVMTETDFGECTEVQYIIQREVEKH